jgi:hypothetical protein
MSLFIKKPEVASLAERYARITGLNKTDAVQRALTLALADEVRKPSLAQVVAGIQSHARAQGFAPLDDQKTFMDDLSGGL